MTPLSKCPLHANPSPTLLISPLLTSLSTALECPHLIPPLPPVAVIARRALSLEDTAPRLVRLGDVFEAGVVCLLADAVPPGSQVVVSLTGYDQDLVTLLPPNQAGAIPFITVSTGASKTIPGRSTCPGILVSKEYPFCSCVECV